MDTHPSESTSTVPEVVFNVPKEESTETSSAGKVLPKVPQLVREKKEHIYGPLVVSLGLIYIRPQYPYSGNFKEIVQRGLLGDDTDIPPDIYNQILKRMPEIRSFYQIPEAAAREAAGVAAAAALTAGVAAAEAAEAAAGASKAAKAVVWAAAEAAEAAKAAAETALRRAEAALRRVAEASEAAAAAAEVTRGERAVAAAVVATEAARAARAAAANVASRTATGAAAMAVNSAAVVVAAAVEEEAAAEAMVRDACLVIYNMERVLQNLKIVHHATRTIGALEMTLMANDFCKLENQIPWWMIESLITSIHGDVHGKTRIRMYLNFANFWEYDKLKQLPWEASKDEEPPPHLLEARRRIFLKKKNVNTSNTHTQLARIPLQSATQLRAKGIHFTKSSDFLDDITFVSKYWLFGMLHLPVLRVDSETTTFFSNVIVLEMSPGSNSTDFPVTSYINFMKLLIQSPKDVELLQEKGIIICDLMDSHEVVRTFNEIDAHEVYNSFIFNIKMKINKHCNHRGKRWMAELFDTYFGSPWTAIALLAATFLLCLTFLQTYYTLNPVK